MGERAAMNIVEATKHYEHWLGQHVPLVKTDLKRKHATMQESAFGFLRATYYRWAQQFPKLCPEFANAPRLLAVGDLHLENFGNWRDADARLAWGVNDFDEAHRTAYAHDLVRLAASALVAIDEGSFYVGTRRAVSEVLIGYAKALAADAPHPFVLEENDTALRTLATSDRRSPRKFWKKVLTEKTVEPDAEARVLLLRELPKGTEAVVFKRRTAGAGSLGLPRVVASGLLNGSRVAREVKARAPASAHWANGAVDAVAPADTAAIIARLARPADPFFRVTPGWTVRRLGPHSESIALAEIADAAERRAVLNAMGRETANVHRATKAARVAVLRHLAKQKDGWLHDAAERMAEAVRKDWRVWKKQT
jgi:uncharacterized protein DUF2252